MECVYSSSFRSPWVGWPSALSSVHSLSQIDVFPSLRSLPPLLFVLPFLPSFLPSLPVSPDQGVGMVVTLAQSGKVLRLNMAAPQVFSAMLMVMTPIMFSTNPAFTCCQCSEKHGSQTECFTTMYSTSLHPNWIAPFHYWFQWLNQSITFIYRIKPFLYQ